MAVNEWTSLKNVGSAFPKPYKKSYSHIDNDIGELPLHC